MHHGSDSPGAGGAATALVTGANRGIGTEVCRQLAATLPDSGPTGGFFRDGQPVPW
jgi:hypothetical protein